jgi:peptidoglycan hydrolase CwlO-like protein
VQPKTASSGRSRIRVRGESRFRRRRLIAIGVPTLAIAAAAGGGLAGAADPSLDTRIDSANSDADQLEQRAATQAARLGELDQQARAAGAQEMVLAARIETAVAQSRELASQLTAAEAELEAARERFKTALSELADRLVEIYKEADPDSITLLLQSDGFDDLQTRAEYLGALHDADVSLADRVQRLRDERAAQYHAVADLKAQIDQQATQLDADRAAFAATAAETRAAASELADARAATGSELSAVQSRIDELEQERAEREAAEREAAEQQASEGAPAFSGGPYAIPTYIVMCESGGNYSALNESSGAGGAYQILPSTWRAYGGQGLPHQASKAEQDRIAAMIWADSGPSAWSCA